MQEVPTAPRPIMLPPAEARPAADPHLPRLALIGNPN